jgi:hypothetical protein
MEQEIVDESIKQLKEEFQNNPLNFVTERDCVIRLVELLKSKRPPGDKTVQAEAKIDPNVPKKKRNYVEAIGKPQMIDRIHTEVNYGEKSKLDLIVFNGEKVIIRINKNCTKYFRPEDFDYAVELKFIKNKPSPYRDLMKRFEDDIKKLEALNEKVKKYLIIISNKNIFEDEQRKFKELERKCKEKNINLVDIYPSLP